VDLLKATGIGEAVESAALDGARSFAIFDLHPANKLRMISA